MMDTPSQPDWVIGELPPKYIELAEQIAALRQQAREYEEITGVLWQTGPPLTEAVAALFRALHCQTDAMDDAANYDLRVQLENGHRFLVQVVGAPAPLDRKSPQIARILRALQEDAEPGDRVLLAANIFHDTPVSSRREELADTEALRLIQGLGANLVPTATLFGMWKYSLQDAPGVKKTLARLHQLNGGIFR